MAAIEQQLQCLLGQHLTQSSEGLTAAAKLKKWQQQVQQAEMGLLMNRGNRQMRLDAVQAEQLQLERAQLQVTQAGRSLEQVQANKVESKARLNGVILQERNKLKALQEDLKDVKLDIAEGSRQTVKLKAVSASLPNLQIEVEDRAKRQALLMEQQKMNANLAALTAIRNKLLNKQEEKATSEVMRGKISCASHNIEQMSAAAAAKTRDIAALKAHLQQDVDKQEYISVLKAQIDAAERRPSSAGVPKRPFVEGKEGHRGKTASTLPCGEIYLHPAQAHKQTVLESKAMWKSADFLSCQSKGEAADVEHDAEEDGHIWQIGSALH